MGLIGGDVGFRILCWIRPGIPANQQESAYCSASKLDVHFGADLWAAVQDREVADYGSGFGGTAIELAKKGARSVVGIEIQEHMRAQSRMRALREGVGDRVAFVLHPANPVDVIVSLDSFEHFAEPESELRRMYDLLRPGGLLFASFGPTWYHPFGGHLFSVFPWAHLVFTEQALIRWRSTFKSDGATRFGEVAGGLNQMTIARFENMVRRSRFERIRLEPVPIRRLKAVSGSLTREFTSSVVHATLRRPPSS